MKKEDILKNGGRDVTNEIEKDFIKCIYDTSPQIILRHKGLEIGYIRIKNNIRELQLTHKNYQLDGENKIYYQKK